MNFYYIASVIVAASLAFGGFTQHQLTTERENIRLIEIELEVTKGVVAHYQVLTEKQKLQLAEAQERAKQIKQVVTSKVKAIKAKPIDDTLVAIKASGIATAEEVGDLWNK